MPAKPSVFSRPARIAANVAVDLRKLDLNVGLSGGVGNDGFGSLIADMLGRTGVDCSRLSRSDKLPTSGTMIVNVRGEDRRFIHCIGANAEYDASAITAEVLKQTVQRTCREREALQTLLAARGLVWRRSSANFVTFQLGRGAAPLAARMQTFGYSIKTLGGLLEGWVRLSLPCDEMIFQSLIQALAQSLDCCANGDAP